MTAKLSARLLLKSVMILIEIHFFFLSPHPPFGLFDYCTIAGEGGGVLVDQRSNPDVCRHMIHKHQIS